MTANLRRLARRVKKRVSAADTQAAAMRAYYRENPVDFITEVIGATPHDYQAEIITGLQKHHRVAVKSLHGVGKTATAAFAALWILTCFETEVKVILTASVGRQLTKFLLPEVRKWGLKADWAKIGLSLQDNREILKTEINFSMNDNAHSLFSASPANYTGIEGAHAETLFYVFDEAKAIPDNIFDAIEGAFANEATDGHRAYALAISTPAEPVGRFADIHKGKPGLENWHTINITLDQGIASGQVSMVWANRMKALWGEDSALYKNRVLGAFADAGERSLFKVSHIEAAFERWRDVRGSGDGVPRWASDIATGAGLDKSTIGRIRGAVVERLDAYDLDEMQIVDLLRRDIGAQVSPIIAIDSDGVGSGSYARMKQLGYRPLGYKGSRKTDKADASGMLQFRNVRAASYWALRQAIDPHSVGYTGLALPPNDNLLRELMAHEWEERNGIINIIDKDQIRAKLGGASPDLADTVVMLLWTAYRPSLPQFI